MEVKSAFLIIVILIAGGLIYANSQGLILSFTPVFCSDYTYICCQEREWDGLPTNAILEPKGGTFVTCPSTATRCKITSLEEYYTQTFPPWSTGWFEPKDLYIAGRNAECYLTGWIQDNFYCVGETQITRYTYDQFKPGTKIYAKRGNKGRISYTIYGEALRECQGGGCGDSGGVSVLGANGCSFKIEDLRWTGQPYSGSLDDVKPSDFPSDWRLSGTVPSGLCFKIPESRHICGYEEETCSSDYDCVSGHTLIYNGKGAECRGTLLELYGCRRYNETQGSSQWYAGSRCEVVQTIPVQCCPTAGSCGTLGTCDPKTFTCTAPPNVECRNDWECGVQQYCDRNTKTILKDACVNEKCTKQTVKNVDCCYDSDCANGYYCFTDYTCQKLLEDKTTCPYACCENERSYYDKPCAENNICCPDNKCKLSCEGTPTLCDYDGTCEPASGETIDTCSDCMEECEEWEYFDFSKQRCLSLGWMIPWNYIIFGIFAVIVVYIVMRGLRRRNE